MRVGTRDLRSEAGRLSNVPEYLRRNASDVQGMYDHLRTVTNANVAPEYVQAIKLNQTVPNGAWTAIVWFLPVVTGDSIEMASGASEATVSKAGHYSMVLTTYWATSAVGIRALRPTINGAGQGSATWVYALNSWHRYAMVWGGWLDEGDTIGADTYQGSGGNLNMLSAGCRLWIGLQRG